MIHVFGAKEDSEVLEDDECVCSPDTPWRETDEGAFVVFHLAVVPVAGGWTCLTCGTSSAAWLPA